MKDISSLAQEIAKIYSQFYKKYTPKTWILSKVKETKWWPYFLKCASIYGNRPEWDTYKFVEAQFESKGKIFPFDLCRKEAWEIFEEYKSRDKDFEKYIARNLLSTYNYIKDWSLKKGFKASNYPEFFSNKEESLLIKRKKFSLYLFSILKSFYEYFYNKLSDEEKDDLIEIEDLMKMRSVIYINEKLKRKMQETLGNEFI